MQSYIAVQPNTTAQSSTAVSGSRRRRRKQQVMDVIWPDDPRHPDFVKAASPVEPVEKTPVKVVPMRKEAVAPVAPVVAVDHYDTEIALLLLAA